MKFTNNGCHVSPKRDIVGSGRSWTRIQNSLLTTWLRTRRHCDETFIQLLSTLTTLLGTRRLEFLSLISTFVFWISAMAKGLFGSLKGVDAFGKVSNV